MSGFEGVPEQYVAHVQYVVAQRNTATGEEWHVSAFMSGKETGEGTELTLALCAGETCAMGTVVVSGSSPDDFAVVSSSGML